MKNKKTILKQIESLTNIINKLKIKRNNPSQQQNINSDIILQTYQNKLIQLSSLYENILVEQLLKNENKKLNKKYNNKKIKLTCE